MDDATQEKQQAQPQPPPNQSANSSATEVIDTAQEKGAAPSAPPAADLNKLDLSQLQGFSFGTKWESKPDDKRQSGRGDNNGGGRRDGGSDSGRARREFGDKRDTRRGDSAPAQRDRRGFRKPQGGSAPSDSLSSRGELQSGGAGQQERRSAVGAGERRQGGSGSYQGARRSGAGGPGGAGGAGGRFFQQHREALQPPYDSPYFAVSFYPEDTSFAALAKTIRSSYRTLELFEIARTVVAKNDRFIALLTRKPSAPTPSSSGDAQPASSAQNKSLREAAIYIARPDGVPFDSEEAVINYVVSQHIGQFFETEQVQVDPPKGNFQVINRCGVTGELLGPPNYHRYNQIVQQHFDARIKHLSFDAFRAKIETLRDEAVVAEWLEKMKTVTRYTWRGTGKKKTAPSSEASPPQTEPLRQETDSESVADVSESEKPSDGEVASTSHETPAAENEAPKPEVAASAVEGSANDKGADEAAPPTSSAAEESSANSAPPEDGAAQATSAAYFDSLEDAKVYLLTHARDKVYRTSDTARFHGNLLEKLPDGEIRRAIEGALERQRRFPLDTANGLRGRLRREHFTIFKKGSKGISYVCAVKRKFRTPGQTFADSISALIDFIERHPMVLVSELPERFLGIKTQVAQPPSATTSTAGSSASEEALPAAPASHAQAEKAEAPVSLSASEESTKDAVAEREALHRLQLDLRWLVTEGYVTEFIDGRLFAAPPVPESRKHAAENADAPDLENFPDAPKPKEPSPEPSSPSQAQPEASSSVELSPATVSESAAGDDGGQEVAPEHSPEPSAREAAIPAPSEAVPPSSSADSLSADSDSPSTGAQPTSPAP